MVSQRAVLVFFSFCLFSFFPRSSFCLSKEYCASLVFESAGKFLPYDFSPEWNDLYEKRHEIEKYYHYLKIRIRYFKQLSENLKGNPQPNLGARIHFSTLLNKNEVSKDFDLDEKRLLAGQLQQLLQETESEFQRNFSPPVVMQAEMIRWLYRYSPSFEVFDALEIKMKGIQIPLQRLSSLLESYRLLQEQEEEEFKAGFFQSKFASTFLQAKKNLWFSCRDELEILLHSFSDVYSYNTALSEKGWLNDIDAKVLRSTFQDFLNEYAGDLGVMAIKLRKFNIDDLPIAERPLQEFQNDLAVFKDEHEEILREISNKRIEIWNETLQKVKEGK